MKTKLSWMLLLFACAAQAAAFAAFTPPVLAPLQQHAQAANLTAQILSRLHYKSTRLDSSMSEKIFDRYLKSLDSEKIFFVQGDVDGFAYARTKLGDAIHREDLRIPFDIFNLYQRRVVERLSFARELLKQEFNFDRNESHQYERASKTWLISGVALGELWRKRVQGDWVQLKLVGKDDKTIRDILDRRYSNSLAGTHNLNSDDVFQIFMSAYASSVDPHSDYLDPRSLQDFDISMKLSLVGIGVLLEQKDAYATIRELVPGGPAALSAKLNIGDRIVGVGQGSDGAMIDVIGWRVDDVVTLLRGNQGSVVRLDLLRGDVGPDGNHTHISIVRSKVEFEQQAAKKFIIPVKHGAITRNVGVISLPMFYQDYDARGKGEKAFKSATGDVKRLLDELKADKVEGVLVDLRNNGGGSLDEAVEMTGLFTGKGPVVQKRNSKGDVRIESAKNTTLAWKGPLVVLINRGSASASEIFAAAIQDYGRGVIIGEPSFGKGTLQALINLDQMAHHEKPKFGALKMTVAQFFRINGGTTQLRGVTPDICLPSTSDLDRFDESSFDNALPWTQIKAANYTLVGNVTGLLPLLQIRHAVRVEKDKDFQYIQKKVAEIKSERKGNVIARDDAECGKERDVRSARVKLRVGSRDVEEGAMRKAHEKRQTVLTKIAPFPDNSLESDDRNLSQDVAGEKVHKGLVDPWLNEAAHILVDEMEIFGTNPKLAARAVSDES